jgi:hypothetical protein
MPVRTGSCSDAVNGGGRTNRKARGPLLCTIISFSRLRTSGTHWRSLYDIQFTLSAGQLGVFDGGECARVPCPGKYPGVPVPGPMSMREERDTQGFINYAKCVSVDVPNPWANLHTAGSSGLIRAHARTGTHP